MLRRTATALAVTLLMLGGTTPAQALTYHAKHCYTYYSQNGVRSLNVCSSVMESDSGLSVWGRYEIWEGPTGVSPYSVTMGRFSLWSRNGTGSWCPGPLPGCNGGDDVLNTTYNNIPASYPNAITANTGHEDNADHRCKTQSDLSHNQPLHIVWIQGGDNRDDYSVASDVWDTSPSCNS
jgi:hypothetical protein